MSEETPVYPNSDTYPQPEAQPEQPAPETPSDPASDPSAAPAVTEPDPGVQTGEPAMPTEQPAEQPATDPAPAEPDPAGDPAPAPADGAVEDSGQDSRRPRGWLETDVKVVTDKFVKGELQLKEDEHLTPHRIASLIQTQESLVKAPSTGAVSAVFDRWAKYGFATFTKTPYAFEDYTEAARTEGLDALKKAYGEKHRADKQAAKQAEAPAPVAAEPDPTPVAEPETQPQALEPEPAF